VIFLFKFEMGHKTVEITCNINNIFGPGTASECTVQLWFKKFCKGDESLEDEEHSDRPLEVDKGQLKGSLKLHLRQIGKVKNLDKWVPYELTANHKNCHFEMSSSLILCNNNEPFLNWMLSGWTEKLPQSTFQGQICTKKKVMVTVWWSGACLIHHSFLNPSETTTSERYAQQINERHWKLQRLQPVLVNRMGPVLLHHDVQPHGAQPVLQNFLHPPHSPDLSQTDGHFFKHLNNDAENAFQEFVKSQSKDFYTTGINKLISHWQKWVDCNGSYFY
ncbi:hypothetical protein FD755_019090, partial [Muntiacus reevesi]